jgi:hypothetical protein
LQVYFAKHPVIAGINKVATQLTEILGPMFWAALIVGFFWAELFVSSTSLGWLAGRARAAKSASSGKSSLWILYAAPPRHSSILYVGIGT